MAITQISNAQISNMRSKSFRGRTPDELDQSVNQWLQAHSDSTIVSMDSHKDEYYCWVVILYRDKTAGVI